MSKVKCLYAHQKGPNAFKVGTLPTKNKHCASAVHEQSATNSDIKNPITPKAKNKVKRFAQFKEDCSKYNLSDAQTSQIDLC